MTIRMDKMSWKQIKRQLENGYDTVVVGIGSTEQHGPSLPLQTDRKTADYLANMVASELGKALQAPTIGIGFCPYHLSFPGTITLQKSTLMAVIGDYVYSLVQHGFKTIVFTNTHGGNNPPLQESLAELREQYTDIRLIHFFDQNTEAALGKLCMQFELSPEEMGMHAGDMEASIMMYIDGANVDTKELVKGFTGAVTDDMRREYYENGFDRLTPNGVAGDQRRASSEKGRVYIETLKKVIIDYIRTEIQRP